MKKMFISAALMLAAVSFAYGNATKMNFNTKNVISVEEIIKLNASTPNVVTFYNVEKISIKNTNNILIRIYDKNWNLILETKNDVNVNLALGDYYVATEKKVRTKYVAR